MSSRLTAAGAAAIFSTKALLSCLMVRNFGFRTSFEALSMYSNAVWMAGDSAPESTSIPPSRARAASTIALSLLFFAVEKDPSPARKLTLWVISAS